MFSQPRRRPKWWHIRRLVGNGDLIPRGFGIAYKRHSHWDSVAYPIPLNILMRLLYLAWVWSLYPFRAWEPKRRENERGERSE